MGFHSLRSITVEGHKQQTYYDILGVSKSSSAAVIKKKYRNLAKKYHPDRQQNDNHKEGSQEEFIKVTNAYEVLSDNDKRKEYDHMLRLKGDPSSSHTSRHSSFDSSNKFFNRRFHSEQDINQRENQNVFVFRTANGNFYYKSDLKNGFSANMFGFEDESPSYYYIFTGILSLLLPLLISLSIFCTPYILLFTCCYCMLFSKKKATIPAPSTRSEDSKPSFGYNNQTTNSSHLADETQSKVHTKPKDVTAKTSKPTESFTTPRAKVVDPSSPLSSRFQSPRFDPTSTKSISSSMFSTHSKKMPPLLDVKLNKQLLFIPNNITIVLCLYQVPIKSQSTSEADASVKISESYNIKLENILQNKIAVKFQKDRIQFAKFICSSSSQLFNVQSVDMSSSSDETNTQSFDFLAVTKSGEKWCGFSLPHLTAARQSVATASSSSSSSAVNSASSSLAQPNVDCVVKSPLPSENQMLDPTNEKCSSSAEGSLDWLLVHSSMKGNTLAERPINSRKRVNSLTSFNSDIEGYANNDLSDDSSIESQISHYIEQWILKILNGEVVWNRTLKREDEDNLGYPIDRLTS